MGVICKYKFDSSIYADLIPEFNSGYSGYIITDEVEGNIITRTIESDSLPTLMRFGRVYVNGETSSDNRTDSLLEVLDIDISGLTSMHSMFRFNTNLTSINCNWDTSNVTTMYSMFFNCTNLISLDVSKWDTDNVTRMDYMFFNCTNLISLDVSNFNTSNVTNMANMFYNCYNLTSLDVSNFDTSNVTRMDYMFYECKSLTTLDVSNWDTSNVTNMSFVFYECKLLTTLDVSNWDTSNVTTMQQVFDICYALNVDVSNWDTSNVTTIYAMFGDCRAMSSLDLSKWNTSKMTNMLGVFWGCTNLVELNISNWDTSKVTNMKKMFYDCTKLTTLDVSNFNTSNVTDTTNMFSNTNSLEVITIFNSNINTINTVGNLTSATIYVDESLDQSQYTGTAPLKVYKEEKLEIKLNSPLLKGDTIEVIDGKICHIHRWDSMILDGNSNWVYFTTNFPTVYAHIDLKKAYADNSKQCVFCENILSEKGSRWSDNNKEMIYIWKWEDEQHENSIYLQIYSKRLSTEDFDGFKQYLSQNPLTIIYKLKEPYYEDITPLQSSIILKTFLESSMTIDTDLPIETKLSYRTNVPSISTLSTRATELAESDNVIHNLMNIIDDEVDE